MGNDGDDTFRGGPDADTMNGGEGQDVYLWFEPDLGGQADTIIDFEPLFDTIRLNGIVSPDIGPAEVISAVDLGDDTGLVLDLTNAPGSDGQPNSFFFVRLQDFDVEDVELVLWQAIGALDFV